MRLVRLNKVIEVNDPDRIRDYKLLGYVETRRGRPRTVNDL